jgi:hypothetical protein
MSKRNNTTKPTTPPSDELTRSRARQGLPPTITDPAIIAAVEALIAAVENERP